MIEDKDVKIAEDPEEAFWTRLQGDSRKSINSLKHEIIIQEQLIKLADEKLAEQKKWQTKQH